MLQSLMVADKCLSEHPSAQLRDANEQLMLAAVRSQEVADAALQALGRVSRSAELDALTHLPNRQLLLDRLAQAMAVAERHGTSLAVLFLDLDNFKPINDQLGHIVGDAVLQLVALRLSSSVRAVDTCGRYGGDEFLVLVTDVAQRADVVAIVNNLRAALAAPAAVGERSLCLTASIGISVYPSDGTDAATLIHLADSAMYQAKKGAPGGYVFHAEITGTDPGARPLLAAEAPSAGPPATAGRMPELDNALLREANAQLVLSALAAQALQAAAEQRQQRQLLLMARLAQTLAEPTLPARLAAACRGDALADEPRMAELEALAQQQITLMSGLLEPMLAGGGGAQTAPALPPQGPG